MEWGAEHSFKLETHMAWIPALLKKNYASIDILYVFKSCNALGVLCYTAPCFSKHLQTPICSYVVWLAFALKSSNDIDKSDSVDFIAKTNQMLMNRMFGPELTWVTILNVGKITLKMIKINARSKSPNVTTTYPQLLFLRSVISSKRLYLRMQRPPWPNVSGENASNYRQKSSSSNMLTNRIRKNNYSDGPIVGHYWYNHFQFMSSRLFRLIGL